MSKVKITDRQKIAALSFAIDCVRDMHGSVTDKDHSAEARSCKCAYGEAVRALCVVRRETYDVVQRAKKDLVKEPRKRCSMHSTALPCGFCI